MFNIKNTNLYHNTILVYTQPINTNYKLTVKIFFNFVQQVTFEIVILFVLYED